MSVGRIEPAPEPEEAAAIVAALETMRAKNSDDLMRSRKRSRWRLAGLIGHPLPPGMKLEGSLWAYSGWKGRE